MDIDPLQVLRDFITLRYRTQTAAAKHWEVSPPFVNAVLSGKKAPTVQMLAEAGLERLLVYRWTTGATAMNDDIPPDLPDLPDLAPVFTLPVKQRDNDTERVLTEVRSYDCFHRRFVIDDHLQQVECRDCGEKLNPMYALAQLARQENRYHELHARYHDELHRLAERSRTKCQHCGKMTSISPA